MPDNRRSLRPVCTASDSGTKTATIGFLGKFDTNNVLLSTVQRLTLTLAATGVGFLLASSFHLNDLQYSSQYFYGATILLAIGLYGSTSQIFIKAFRSNIRIILTAVTLGVLLKVVLIAGFMFLIYRDPAYFLLGVAVAQIDPLSVAATRTNSRLSKDGNSILLAWSSFDDPVTVLLTIYLSVFALSRMGQNGLPSDSIFSGGLPSFGESLLANIIFALCALLLWKLIHVANVRIPRARTGNSRHSDDAALLPLLNILAIVALVILVVISIVYFLMLGLAIVGLFFRPSLGIVSDWLTRAAFLVAAVGLGLVLVNGINWVAGLLLGLGAFTAQVLVGLLITGSLSKTDRGYLAFSQQNGITAIILALLLEPIFRGTAGIVGPAIIFVNLLHGIFTVGWSWVLDRKPVLEPTSLPPSIARPAQITTSLRFTSDPLNSSNASGQSRAGIPVDEKI